MNHEGGQNSEPGDVADVLAHVAGVEEPRDLPPTHCPRCGGEQVQTFLDRSDNRDYKCRSCRYIEMKRPFGWRGEPEVLGPNLLARDGDEIRERRRTVVCLAILAPVALAFALGSFIIVAAFTEDKGSRLPAFVMGVVVMVGTGVLGSRAFRRRSVSLSLLALTLTPVVLFVARLAGWSASEW